MKTAIVFGDKWHELNLLPELEHELFYKFLLISPSYRLCHKLKLKEVRYPKKALPIDWDLVEQTYESCGDVYSIGFEEWWTQIGQKVFSARVDSKVILALDFSRPRQRLEKEIAEIIDMGYRSAQKDRAQLRLLSSKIRLDTLNDRLGLIYWKAVSENLEKPYNGYELAALANIPSKHRSSTKRLAKRTYLSLTARTQLTELVSRQSREARLIAENAARGRFPSKASLPMSVDFDYEYIEGRFCPGAYPFSKDFTHKDRMKHPVFKHLLHLNKRKQNFDSRQDDKKYPELKRLIREFNQIAKRKS